MSIQRLSHGQQKIAKKGERRKKNYSRNRIRKTGVEVTDKLEKKRQ
jgi:hypothetical protein